MTPRLMWLIPPLIGAVIGYVTNAVAIKMLFRPLKEVRLFGIRLPFTPGILPRQRHKLAENIGAIVERQLLTPEILVARLRQEDVQSKLKTAIVGYMEKLINAPDTAKSLADFLKKPEIHRLLEIHGRVFLNNAILRLNAFQRFFLTAGQFDNTLHDRMPEIIDDLIRQLDEIRKDRDIQAEILTFLGDEISERSLQSLEEKSAVLLKTINIKALVSARIDSLDMLSVEHIVLDVMANQLKWINIFGAILGALIGLFQSVFSWFIR
ncbi:DUF445 family protein [Treponema primitia]|uniref:DUF445 domain-containing protein n=1 Tax=Treponema primitia TaxID=88058 RepID=UPI00397EBFF9